MTVRVRFPDGWIPLSSTDLEGHSNEIVDDDAVRWDADLADAEWDQWQIWMDGGGTYSRYLCTLVHFLAVAGEGPPVVILRDFFESFADVQPWVDKATTYAMRCDELDQERKRKEQIRRGAP